MEWLLWIAVVIILGLAAVAGSGRFGSMPAAVHDTPAPTLPDGELAGDDLRRVQFATVVRGYSMAQVDALLDRLARQLDDRTPQAAASEAPVLAPSAIMAPDDAFDEAPQRERKRGTDGSDEAPHG